MSQHCSHCNKGIAYGHHVSHAKNRTKRLFRPNLHQHKVLVSGLVKRVKLCSKCIKRIKNFGFIGKYKKYEPNVLRKLQDKKKKEELKVTKESEQKITPKIAEKKKEEETKEKEKLQKPMKKEKAKRKPAKKSKKEEKLQIEDIVGSKS